MAKPLVAFKLEERQLVKLDKIAANLGWNRSSVIRQLIEESPMPKKRYLLGEVERTELAEVK